MPPTSIRADLIAIIGIIVSFIGIIVSIVLVKDGRKFLEKKINSINNRIKKLWSYYFFQALILLILGVTIQLILMKFNYVDVNIAISLTSVLFITFLMLLLLYNSLNGSLGKINQEVRQSSLSINRLTEIEKVELNIIKEKWGIFLEQVSSNISFTAIYPVLTMAEPYDINGLTVIVLVPDILESSVRNLEDRLKDLEPLLESIYSKPYKLAVYTTKDTHLSTMNL